jgi:hypothetical protein
VATPEIDARIEAQKRNLDACCSATPSSTLTSDHRKLLKDLEDQKRKEVAELRKAAMAPPLRASASANFQPGRTGTEPMLAGSEVQVASLKARVAEFTARYAAGPRFVEDGAADRSRGAQLNRDYAIIKKNYEDLVGRKQSAVMSGELDVASGVADFRLIDPPRVTPKPVSPNRLAAAAAGPGGRHGAGLAVAFVASQLRPVFTDANELRAKTGPADAGRHLDVAQRRRASGRAQRHDPVLRGVGRAGRHVRRRAGGHGHSCHDGLIAMSLDRTSRAAPGTTPAGRRRRARTREPASQAGPAGRCPPNRRARPAHRGCPAAGATSSNRHLDLEMLAAKGIVTPNAPRSFIADQYRVIKRPADRQCRGPGRGAVKHANLIMVTSALSGEGKSFTSINLAMSIAAELDHTVMLVDADVARPSVLKVLGLPPRRAAGSAGRQGRPGEHAAAHQRRQADPAAQRHARTPRPPNCWRPTPWPPAGRHGHALLRPHRHLRFAAAAADHRVARAGHAHGPDRRGRARRPHLQAEVQHALSTIEPAPSA